MNARRVRDLKVQYAISLIDVLRTLCEIGERSEEHAEAIRQVENALLSCLNQPAPTDSNWDTEHFSE